jgi:hypothetical protein
MRILLAAALTVCFSGPAGAVYQSVDGTGQALIYPYYTVQSAGGNPFNTYVSIVNHGGDTKALRVRFREGRLGATVASFNLFLFPNDVWAGAVVPFGNLADLGARVISKDSSCSDPAFEFSSDFLPPPGDVRGITFSNTQYTGAQSDGAGTGLDRTREGYVEVFEMGTRPGVITSCDALRALAPSAWAAPTGKISGTLTLINVASGMDFTVNADALAGLASRPYVRASNDPYPAFDAAEIDPVSVVNANGLVYRSMWSRGLDAVSATLMRSKWVYEYVLDTGTQSLTDFVVTLPTRRHHTTATAMTAPFSRPLAWSSTCLPIAQVPIGEVLGMTFTNRDEGFGIVGPDGFGGAGLVEPRICAAAAVASPTNGAAHIPVNVDGSFVLGSLALGLTGGRISGERRTAIQIAGSFMSGGTFEFAAADTARLTSLPTSSRIDPSTGTSTAGAHVFTGLPVVGFGVRIFQNGTLNCGGTACQGNYGGAFPLRSTRSISPSP